MSFTFLVFLRLRCFRKFLSAFERPFFDKFQSSICLTCIYRSCKNVKRFLECKRQREILFILSVTSFPTEATSFSFLAFFCFLSFFLFLKIHFVNVSLNHSKNYGCISDLLLCNFDICERDLVWLSDTQNSYFFVQNQFGQINDHGLQ